MLQIFCKNNNNIKSFPIGSSLLDIYKGFNLNIPFEPVSARVNNKTKGLNYRVYNNKDVEFLNIIDPSGMRTYTRSLFFILCKAVSDLYPNGKISLEHPVSKGYYCDLQIGRKVGLDDVINIKKRMKEIIKNDIPFHRFEEHTSEVVKLFEEKKMYDKVQLLKTTGNLYSYYYTLGDCVDYYYSSLLPSSGYIKLFDIIKYYDGLLLRIPNRNNPNELEEIIKQEKMLEAFQEQHNWNKIMGVSTVGELNMACKKRRTTDIINISEALQEKKIAHIADDIIERGKNGKRVKVVLISGPSSSGKTTFSKRLSIQLMASEIKPSPISLDNYFVDRENTPKDENGEYDYESLDALDLDFFNLQLRKLLNGEEIEKPFFNFSTGKREFHGEKLKIDDNSIIILEGIHALNPKLTPNIPKESVFKIYVSALTTILLDHHNYIPTSDNRLLRRILRDYKYRGYSAEDTIKRWPSVKAGEEKWIFPFQENADAMFNSALIYELAVLKEHVEPILRRVPNSVPEYSEAHRLRKFLDYFSPIQDKELPPTSVLREFLGGSSLHY